MTYPKGWEPISPLRDFIDDHPGWPRRFLRGIDAIKQSQYLPDDAEDLARIWWICRGDSLNSTLSISRRHPFPLMALHPVLLEEGGLPKRCEEFFFHELSHLIVGFFLYGQGHGKTWVHCMQAFGYEEKTFAFEHSLQTWRDQRKRVKWEKKQSDLAFRAIGG